MPITVEIADKHAKKSSLKKVFDYFDYVDHKFSTYKDTSEITKINKGKLKESEYSSDMKKIFRMADETKDLTGGYFNITHKGKIDPSGVVKGWSIYKAAKILKKEGYKNFYINAGGDIQVSGENEDGGAWKVGIRNPFDLNQIVKVVYLNKEGLATSGTYERGQHIYDPISGRDEINDILSITVIGKNIYEADRFATAAFAMGREGISFIEKLSGFEGYMIDTKGLAIFTSGFDKYLQ